MIMNDTENNHSTNNTHSYQKNIDAIANLKYLNKNFQIERPFTAQHIENGLKK